MTAPQAMPTTADRRLAASQSMLPPGLVFSDTPSRIVALILDGLVVGAITAVPAGLLGFYDIRYPGFMDRTAFTMVTLLGFAIQAVYFVWFWSGGRRGTPGQRVLGIQVANAFDGQPLSTRQAITRFLGIGGWIGLPFSLPVFAVAMVSLVVSTVYGLALIASVPMSATRQGLHDRLSGSAVVRPANADNHWAKRIIWLLVGLAILEVLLVAASWSVMAPFMDRFWTEYARWLWPS